MQSICKADLCARNCRSDQWKKYFFFSLNGGSLIKTITKKTPTQIGHHKLWRVLLNRRQSGCLKLKSGQLSRGQMWFLGSYFSILGNLGSFELSHTHRCRHSQAHGFLARVTVCRPRYCSRECLDPTTMLRFSLSTHGQSLIHGF